MPKILVTGFGPFQGVPTNPSWENIKQIPSRIDGVDIALAEIPVAYERAQRVFSEKLSEHNPDAILCFGVSVGIPQWRCEAVGWNYASFQDIDGRNPNSLLIPSGKLGYPSTFGVDNMLRWINSSTSGIRGVASYDAGGYLCNAVLAYISEYYLSRGRHIPPMGFWHVGDQQPRQGRPTVEHLIRQVISQVIRNPSWKSPVVPWSSLQSTGSGSGGTGNGGSPQPPPTSGANHTLAPCLVPPRKEYWPYSTREDQQLYVFKFANIRGMEQVASFEPTSSAFAWQKADGLPAEDTQALPLSGSSPISITAQFNGAGTNLVSSSKTNWGVAFRDNFYYANESVIGVRFSRGTNFSSQPIVFTVSGTASNGTRFTEKWRLDVTSSQPGSTGTFTKI